MQMNDEPASLFRFILFASVALVHTLCLRNQCTSRHETIKSKRSRLRANAKPRQGEDHAKTDSPGTRFHFWRNEAGMVKRGRGRTAYFELGTFARGDHVITVGLQSHRNPNENGIKLLFYKGDLPKRMKLGFLLMRNSAEDHGSSALLGLFIDPSERKSGLSAPFLAIWLSLCLEARIEPKTSIMNKPLLCLVLQHTFGFQPAYKGGTRVGITKAPDGKIGMYAVAGGAQNVTTIYSNRSVKREGIVILQDPPADGAGREIVVQCDLKASDEDPRFEMLQAVVENVIRGPKGDGSFQHVIQSPCALKEALLGEQPDADTVHPS